MRPVDLARTLRRDAAFEAAALDRGKAVLMEAIRQEVEPKRRPTIVPQLRQRVTAVNEGRAMDGNLPSIIDLPAEVAKLTMFRGRTPRATMADRQGTAVRLASYRDSALLTSKFAGIGHWETHPADELIHILDGAATLDVVCDDGPPRSFGLRAGMLAVIPQGAWHRFHSSEGVTLMTATPFPGEKIELDVADPRMVERKPA